MARSSYSIQAPAAVVMVRPRYFTVNTETAIDNRFQRAETENEDLALLGYTEITNAARKLEEHGVKVHLFDDEGNTTPDSVFPNNWFSTHAGGHVAVYPMKARTRRRERRQDVLEMLKSHYRVQDVIDYSGLENDNLFLEGTGAMVLDHVDRIAYAVRSDRTNDIVLERFSTQFNFEPMVFDAYDGDGIPIYHTNVMMCIATDFAIVALEMIANVERREEVRARLEQSGRQVIPITSGQVRNFAGNALEVKGRESRFLALSTTALASLEEDQIGFIREHVGIIPLNIPTIERAGGSVRCTLAGIHLAAR